MPLTLRPFKIGPAVYAHLADYEVFEDGELIGRIMEERQDREVKRPEQAWSWSLTIVDCKMAGIKTSGYGRTLDDVKTAFRRALEEYRAWQQAAPFALRRTGLSRDPDRQDWCVVEGGKEIGRIYEAAAAPTEDVRWFWAHWLVGPAREANLRTHGRAPTLEDAKAQFVAALQAFREWQPK